MMITSIPFTPPSALAALRPANPLPKISIRVISFTQVLLARSFFSIYPDEDVVACPDPVAQSHAKIGSGAIDTGNLNSSPG